MRVSERLGNGVDVELVEQRLVRLLVRGRCQWRHIGWIRRMKIRDRAVPSFVELQVAQEVESIRQKL